MYNIFTKRKIWVAVMTSEIDGAVEIHKELFNKRPGAWAYVLAWNEKFNRIMSFAVLDCEYIPRGNFLHSYTKEFEIEVD